MYRHYGSILKFLTIALVLLLSLQIIGGTLTLQGRLDFIENFDTTTNGAALYLTSYGQTVMQEGAEMNFIGNTASIGAAIVVETQSVVSELQRVAFNPLCFIRYGPAPFQSPLNWEKVSSSEVVSVGLEA